MKRVKLGYIEMTGLKRLKLARLFKAVPKLIYLVKSDHSTIEECEFEGRFLLSPEACAMAGCPWIL